MVILEAGKKRLRREEGEHPFADHPHFSSEAVAARQATHDRLRGRLSGPSGRLHP